MKRVEHLKEECEKCGETWKKARDKSRTRGGSIPVEVQEKLRKVNLNKNN